MKKSNKINYINSLNTYIASAKSAVATEQAAARANTLQLIASIAALSIFLLENKDTSICDKNYTLSYKKLKAYIKKYIYNDNATRSDYMRIAAAVYVADRVYPIIDEGEDITAACEKFVQAYSSVNDLYIESGAKKASGGQAGKRKSEQKTKTTAVDAGAESDSTTESVSTKTTYQKVAENFTTLNKLLSKVEKSDLTPDFIKLIESNLGELDNIVKIVVAKSKLNYKSSKKAA